jgi:hypothetical protein
MATPKTVISEQFYHKTSTARFELSSYKDVTKFKIEIAPQLQRDGVPVEKRFDYEKKISMVFGLGEILRIKRFFEQILNPAKGVPQDGYTIEHFFEVNGEKKKSALILKRAENKGKNDPKSPYNFAHTVIMTLYSSMKGASVSFGLSEEESYWVINMMPYFAWGFMKENARIVEENRLTKTQFGSLQASDPSARSPYRAPAAGADVSGEEGTSDPTSSSEAFPTDSAFDDIPF